MIEPTDARRFEETLLPHLDAAYNLARWLIGDEVDAEDVVQEAYLRAFRFFGGFRGANGRAWLLGIVRNTCYNWQEKKARHRSTLYDEELFDPTNGGAVVAQENPESIFSRLEDLMMLDQALKKLPVEFREVLVLRDLEDLSYKEIAEVAEIPIGTVMSRLSRGRRMLLAHLRRSQEVVDGM
ncbi:MAG: sigma-70 family RNA polymerase sigma factor [Sulfurifustis sp.]